MGDGPRQSFEVEPIEIALLLEGIYQRYGYDFRSYARASIERRARQFLVSGGYESFSELTGRVLHDRDLFSRLVRYFSISVTEMFRDPGVYRAIRTEVVPLLRTWPHVKLWCAGCATGEEVYSLAIVLREEGLYEKCTLFATDFNDSSLETARSAVYSSQTLQTATRNYQKAGGKEPFSRYYHSKYDAARLDPALQERITFANHNLVTDRVFGDMHLVLCRNVLIYFNQDLQNRVLQLFTDSLTRGGTLCLGTREDLRFSPVAGAYQVVDEEARIFRKSADPPTEALP